MNYLLLIYEDEREMIARGETEPEILDEYRAFTQRIISTGEFKGGEALQPTTTATSVRVRNGEVLLTDGPFAESREQLGGFYLVEAANLDRAIEIARQLPSARYGTIEIRPILVWQS